MTSLAAVVPDTTTMSGGAYVSVFGVPWPLYKVVAVVAAVVVAAMVFTFTASGVAAMWASGGVLLAIWWGGYRLARRRWDDGERDFYAENRARL
ncbi:hypothetical protein [Gordonia hydrophobica]|uniref:UsfY protein n=1 Tax=Gordonia hydrophobica TaxID=40516 RepID=A0ABZ2U1L3_9ACTN|nr:hypothetical protein [Gordonia hydrophobica]MBM7367134.1 hypothetical protein [Gordonia hydrophobica]